MKEVVSEFNYILTDLDGTLIEMDEMKFANEYFKMLQDHMKDYLNPENLFYTIMSCIEEITKNPDGKTSNYDRFFDVLLRKLGFEDKKTLLEQKFTEFYKKEFPKLSVLAKPNRELVEFLRELRKEGKGLILATNPVFPEIAILERLSWSGMKPEEFLLITHMENSRYCKPDTRYFKEICEKLSAKPEECLMIGNDSHYDSTCEEIGIKYVDVRDLV
ncbi:MAG: hypothetical protein PWQ20_230 [Thermotogaceae bacterium]|jgi:FMN phosphatase YigB (HAD superfamily)|nr:hypothetical protein [Thermotogaceae bacterium]MDN5337160.1 hypothetical protein [Thermotogaceae bacterium]